MKQMKRVLSFLLTLVLLLTSATFSTPVKAAEKSGSSDAIVITVDSKTAVPGGKVNVNIVIKNNPGVLGATMEISYAEGLTLSNVTAGEAFSYLTFTKPG